MPESLRTHGDVIGLIRIFYHLNLAIIINFVGQLFADSVVSVRLPGSPTTTDCVHVYACVYCRYVCMIHDVYVCSCDPIMI